MARSTAPEKSALVTGAASGIGRATVLRLAAAGWSVWAAARRAADLAALVAEAPGVRAVELDVTRAEDCARLAGEWSERPLGALVNNAGMAIAVPSEFLPPALLREQLETNLVGALAVTQAVLPALRRARGRLVFVSSISGRVAFPFFGAYNASKFALEGLADTLRQELAPAGIGVVTIEPGPVQTGIARRTLERWLATRAELPARAETYYGPALDRFEASLRSAGDRGIPADAVARAVERALGAARPRARYPVGRNAVVYDLLARFAPAAWLDRRNCRGLLGGPEGS